MDFDRHMEVARPEATEEIMAVIIIVFFVFCFFLLFILFIHINVKPVHQTQITHRKDLPAMQDLESMAWETALTRLRFSLPYI